MAVKDSNEIPVGNMYVLGDYHFAIERTSVPGSTNDKIEAICTKLNESKRARKSIQVSSGINIKGWSVEANETEASVYIDTSKYVPTGGIATSGPIQSCIQTNTDDRHGGRGTETNTIEFTTEVHLVGSMENGLFRVYCVADRPFSSHWVGVTNGYVSQDLTISSSAVNYKGTTVYVAVNSGYTPASDTFPSIPTPVNSRSAALDYIMAQTGNSNLLVGRFAIDIKDAGGVGPGSDWVDPGDYDPDWEPDDPTHTLYVEVTGSLSGRHNDPIVDPSYSYIPADKETVKDYGCGGDGGHGGGGGAGASTVVIHKFATNQANSKEVTALARRHGYGSGGGKGGKGGDGCILVYY